MSTEGSVLIECHAAPQDGQAKGLVLKKWKHFSKLFCFFLFSKWTFFIRLRKKVWQNKLIFLLLLLNQKLLESCLAKKTWAGLFWRITDL